MKLLFDLSATQPNVTGKMHGGGKYAIAVFDQLIKDKSEMACVYNSNLYLDPQVKAKLTENNIPLHDLKDRTLQEILNSEHYDAYYTAMLQRGIKVPANTRKICTIHGLRELEMPRDWWFLKYKSSTYQAIKNFIILTIYPWWRKVLLKRARATLLDEGLEYVTVSNHTKYSCLSFVPELKAENIKVCYSPSTTRTKTEDIEPYTTEYKYILLVSANRYEKNALRVLKAMDEIYEEHPEYREIRVIATGAKEDSFRHKFRYKSLMNFAGYVSEEELESLYKGAFMLVYPSLNEGFGYPPLEAMRFGVPVIASSFTSISEVCGDGAMYSNPLDYKEIKGRILRMLNEPDLRAQYAQRGLKRYEYITRRQRSDLEQLCKFITQPKAE